VMSMPRLARSVDTPTPAKLRRVIFYLGNQAHLPCFPDRTDSSHAGHKPWSPGHGGSSAGEWG
jgi:hypothetical protein